MLNQIVIVGVVNEIPVLKHTNSNVSFAQVTLKVERGFKSSEGEYEYDELTCTLWRGIAESCIDVCEVGSLLAIKGRIQSNKYTTDENKTYVNYELVAEKVSFLTTR